jgi:hypothetical protein
VAKHVHAAELRVVVAAKLAAEADAVLAAHHLQKLGAHLATALTRLHVKKIELNKSLEAGSTRGNKSREERSNA